MAVSEDTTAPLRYTHALWGEVVCGSKEALQQLGIGDGLMFPGEPGGPKRKLSCRDPRGFPCRVTVFYDECFCAYISFPGRDRPTGAAPEDFAPGVRRCTNYFWHDEYIGTGEALVAAGLVRAEHLPGQPGMRKVSVTIFADGTIPTGPRTAGYGKKGRMLGTKRISRVSKATFEMRILVSEDESRRRIEASKRADSEYELRMQALPRPAPLVHKLRAAEAAKRRAKMRLVWSKPVFQPCLVL